MTMDGDGFTLEANTRNRYNIVTRPGCAGDRGLALARACQQLVKYAHKDDSIHLIYEPTSIAVDSTRAIAVPDIQLKDVPQLPRPKH